MAFSFLTQEIAMDLGTANTVIFNNDEIVLGVVSEIMEDGCTVMTDKRLNSCRHMDFEYLFKPHYKIPVRTEIRLRKAYEHYLAHKMRNIKEIKTKK